MNDIWTFLIALVALPYLLVPVLIRRNQFFALQPRLRAVLGSFLPQPVEAYFEECTSTLTNLGFESRIDAVSLDFGPNLRVFMRLFVETKNSIIAICSAILPDGKTEPIGNFIEFSSRFADGHEISTHNSDLLGAPIEPRKKITTTLPKIDDIAILFAIHERSVHNMGVRRKKTNFLPVRGAELEYLIQSFRSDLSKQASLGCLMLDKTNNCYRPTWAGAFLMGWYSMWPIGPLMRVWQRFRARLRMWALERANV